MSNASIEPRICGSAPPNGASPFGRFIVLGYSDGPTSGAAECADGSAGYRFELLASDDDGAYDREAWDQGEELRVYSLAALPAGTFQRLADVLARVEEPRWPVWVPRWTFESQDLARGIEGEVDALMAAPPSDLVLASRNIVKEVIMVKAASHQDLVGVRDWFMFLGIIPSG
jgi:hypothetical protein